MLELKKITKIYETNSFKQQALDEVVLISAKMNLSLFWDHQEAGKQLY